MKIKMAHSILIIIRSVSRHCHEFTTFLFESLLQLKTEKGKQVSTWCRQIYERVLDPHRLEHLWSIWKRKWRFLINIKYKIWSEFFQSLQTFQNYICFLLFWIQNLPININSVLIIDFNPYIKFLIFCHLIFF